MRISARSAILASATVVACTYAGRTTTVTQLAPDAAFTCVLQQVNRLGYTVTISERAGGLLRAERQTNNGLLMALSGTKFYDELSIAVVPASGAGSDITVNATTSEQKTVLGRQTMAVSTKAKAGADSVRVRCAGTPS